MAQDNRMSERLSQKVEINVRQLIGDLTMQTIVLKSMLELQGEGQQQPAAAAAEPGTDPAAADLAGSQGARADTSAAGARCSFAPTVKYQGQLNR